MPPRTAGAASLRQPPGAERAQPCLGLPGQAGAGAAQLGPAPAAPGPGRAGCPARPTGPAPRPAPGSPRRDPGASPRASTAARTSATSASAARSRRSPATAAARSAMAAASSWSPAARAHHAWASRASTWPSTGPTATASSAQGPGRRRVLLGQQPGQAGQRRHQPLHVARRAGHLRRLGERGPGQGGAAPGGVDLAHLPERVGHHHRPQPLEHGGGPVEVVDGQLEPAQPGVGLAPVGQGDGPERRVAAEVGQADGQVELDDGLGVEALLVEPRPAVEPDADDLEQVAGPLGVVERPEVVAVVGQPVAVERGHQRLHGVGGGQRPVVAAGPGPGHGVVGQGAAAVAVAPQPVGGGGPGHQQGVVGRLRGPRPPGRPGRRWRGRWPGRPAGGG